MSLMHVTIRRHLGSVGYTLGTLDIDGEPLCYTLEDQVRELPGLPPSAWKIKGQTAIPAGTYALIIDMSARFGRRMPHVLAVPGFEGIRIHPGNTAADTEGCILLGYGQAGASITRSRDAYAAFFARLDAHIRAGGAAQLTIGG